MNIRSEIKKITNIAPLPTIANQVIRLANDFDSSAQALGELIRMDQALTGKILRVANSSYYGFTRKIGNVDHAIVVLGFNEITSITLALCLVNNYPIEENPYLSRQEFWKHSVGTGFIARALSKLKPDLYGDNAFVAGLLHDFGKVVLIQFYPDEFFKIIEAAINQKKPLNQVSRELINIDHSEIGQKVIEEWNLPSSLIQAVRYHHSPEEVSEEDSFVHITHLANILCHRHGIGKSGNPNPDEPSQVSLAALGLEDQDLDELWEDLNVDTDSIGMFLG